MSKTKLKNFYEKDHAFTKDDFNNIHDSLVRFCKGEQKMCIPVQADDDDNIIGDALNALEYQYAQEVTDVLCAELTEDADTGQFGMVIWLDKDKKKATLLASQIEKHLSTLTLLNK